MDPITLAIVTAVATGIGKVGEQAITDAYNALKKSLEKKFGTSSEVIRAVEGVEKRPNSESRKAVLQEEVNSANAHQDSDLLATAKTLLTLLNKAQTKPIKSTVIKQKAGDNAMQIGQVNGTLKIKR